LDTFYEQSHLVELNVPVICSKQRINQYNVLHIAVSFGSQTAVDEESSSASMTDFPGTLK